VPLEDIRPRKKKRTVFQHKDFAGDDGLKVLDILPYRARDSTRVSTERQLAGYKKWNSSTDERLAEREYLRDVAENSLPLLHSELAQNLRYDLFPHDSWEDRQLLEDLVNYVTEIPGHVFNVPAKRTALLNLINTLSERYTMFATLVNAMKVTYGDDLKFWFQPFLWLLYNGILSQIKRLDDTPPEQRDKAYYTIDQLCGMLLWGVR
jgi:hypothetical protein